MLPLGWILAITWRNGLVGLWLAMSVGWLVATVLYLAVVLGSDWQQQADNAKRRNNSSNESKDPLPFDKQDFSTVELVQNISNGENNNF